MRISYNKLWKMLIDKNMNKHDLAEKSCQFSFHCQIKQRCEYHHRCTSENL